MENLDNSVGEMTPLEIVKPNEKMLTILEKIIDANLLIAKALCRSSIMIVNPDSAKSVRKPVRSEV